MKRSSAQAAPSATNEPHPRHSLQPGRELYWYRIEREDIASGRYVFTGGLEALGKQALAQELEEALAGSRLWSRGQSGYGEAGDLTEVLEYYGEMTRALVEAGSLAQP